MTDLLQELLADLPTMQQAERVALRLVTAAVLGAVIGAQREFVGKAAGLRTHMLVSLGTAFFVIACIEAGMPLSDVSRVIQGLTTGVGFIGAGAILKRSEAGEIRGLTTAASLWVTAAVGVATGLGRLGSALLGVALGWIILVVFSRVADFLARRGPGEDKDSEP